MIEPDDFGYGSVQTFAHVGDPTPAPDHAPFWNHWYQAVTSERPFLRRRLSEDPSDPTATHEFDSAGGVRIGGTVIAPPEGVRTKGALVVVHGTAPRRCEVEQARWSHVANRGVAVFAVRLRGFPGSQRETGDLRTPDQLGAGWLARGLAAEDHSEWVVPHAVADVFNACRAMRNWMLGHRGGDEHPIESDPETSGHPTVMLFGESLGGGIAVMVAAQFAGRLPRDHVIDRLALGLPSLGDWGWRFAHRPCGAALDLDKVLRHHASRRDELVERVRLCDAVVHASKVRRPTLGKLAHKDDIVPAPTAAAAFNAIDADPAQKWRFLAPYGHIDGGISNARRHALFERCMGDFFDPAHRPIDSMRAWEPVMHTGKQGPDGWAPVPEQPASDNRDGSGPARSLFHEDLSLGDREAALIEAYRATGRTLDALPYTDAFDRLLAACGHDNPRDALHTLQRLRKAGRLPRLGRTTETPPRIDAEQQALIESLVVEHAGSLGQRDRLPYSDAFDRVLEAFNERAGASISAHDLWRLIARIAK
ncbi:MAG: acetylxylan esterase [Planctomycetota bacterium]